MKKAFKLLLLALIGTFALASCEDVPAPYPNPNPDASQDGGSNTEIAPTGDGTLANPYNVAGVVEFCNSLGSDVESSSEVYVKGKVANNTTTEATITQYGNMTFTLIDEGNTRTTFTAFQVYGPGKKKFTSVSQIKEGDEVIVCGKVINYKGNTPETVGKGAAYVYSINSNAEEPGNPSQPAGEAKGDGTLANPYNVAGVNAYLDGSYDETKEVYFTGIISKFKSGEEPGNSFGNSTFYISEDGQTGGEDFYCYRILGLNGEKFTSADQLKVGDQVVVKSPVTVYTSSYGSTKETVQNKGQLVSVNGKEAYSNGQNSEPSTDQPTTGEEITVAEAMALISALANAGQTDSQYTVTGKIESITEINSQYGNATFVLEGGLTIFRCKDIGNVNFTDENRLKVGDEVKVKGYLKKYVKDDTVTPEVTNGQLISINGSTEGSSTENDNTGGNTGGTTTNDGSKVITFNVGVDKGNCTSSAPGSDQMSKNGITIAITKGALANTDNYRTYKNETMTITSSASNIVSVEITCTADDDAQYGPGNFTAGSGQYTYSGKVGTWTGDAASVSLKATSAQVRATKIVVTLK